MGGGKGGRGFGKPVEAVTEHDGVIETRRRDYWKISTMVKERIYQKKCNRDGREVWRVVYVAWTGL